MSFAAPGLLVFEEIPGWARTPFRPLDAAYGRGDTEGACAAIDTIERIWR